MAARRIGSASLQRLLGNWQQPASRIPAYRQLADSLRLLILDGRLPLDTRLPGERDVAEILHISRTTVTGALAELRSEGYLASRQGSGSLTTLPIARTEPNSARLPLPAVDLSCAALPAGPEIYQAYTRALSQLPEYLELSGYDAAGLPRLRTAIAQRYNARGLPTTADQIMVVNGAVSGFTLLLRLLTGPGDRVIIEHPTYPHAIGAIKGAACRPIPVALPDQGWDTDGLAITIAQAAPRLAYLIADYHNPTGRCMDSATRRTVAEIAARTRTPMVVDETMSELWYDVPPPPPLAAFDDSGHVIMLGSAGKSFWGGLRLGWIRASARTIAALIQMRDTVDLGSPLLEQLACAELLQDAEQILPARRAGLRQQRDETGAAIACQFPEWQLNTPSGGLCWWAELPQPVATMLAANAETLGIRIGAGPRFGIEGAFERFLRVPFTLPVNEIEDALIRIRPVWDRIAAHRVSYPRGGLI
ncbi:PLP-dependent aminotransferase family protein [Candidatus Symbiopectobacterium sp. NZEC127]|uniref:MocR-like transcription factor YczR n=1 Tax=Candidatus Symbiopectobacterium sp. NZEC127 TaxID=2820472 RepID=UPI002226B35E|nr:PLP-dependent aminotransferase family protein [Candidatus Symbiopectobacterium sp. NZEC127]MCW2485357.1 PLP-dependent aminotransferase family protein [Candidatus Symbiopectobacterium sp. NZEC127]